MKEPRIANVIDVVFQKQWRIHSDNDIASFRYRRDVITTHQEPFQWWLSNMARNQY